MKIRHLLLATVEDAFDPNSWSGTAYHIAQSLSRRVDKLTLVSQIPVKRTLLHGSLRLALGPDTYPLWQTRPALKAFSSALDRKVKEAAPDAVLSISSQPIVYSRMAVPTFLVSDVPWKSWREAYSAFEPEPWYARRYARLERAAVHRCSGLFFASHFGVREAARLYGPLAPRAIAVPFGANMKAGVDFNFDAVTGDRTSTRALELLYVGKDWERKGGPLALKIAEELHSKGVLVKLHIVGASPREAVGRDYVRVHGVLRMSVPEQRHRLEALFSTCHFLVVPTRAECFGIVFAEAQTFGLIPVTRLIHATGEIVLDGQTGLTLPDGASASAYADAMLAVYNDRERYAAISWRARSRAATLFDWENTADVIMHEISSTTRPVQSSS